MDIITTSPCAAEGRRIAHSYAGWAAGAGLIPFPFFDVAGLISVQIGMLSAIARLYAVPLERERARTLALSAAGGLAPQGVAIAGVPALLKFAPVVGTLLGVAVMPAAAVASTLAWGEAFIRHLESTRSPKVQASLKIADDRGDERGRTVPDLAGTAAVPAMDVGVAPAPAAEPSMYAAEEPATSASAPAPVETASVAPHDPTPETPAPPETEMPTGADDGQPADRRKVRAAPRRGARVRPRPPRKNN